MKKTMLLAAAATMLTTGMASAATYGKDPFGTLTLNATAKEFCKITGVTTGAGIVNGPPDGLAGGDAIATLDIQRLDVAIDAAGGDSATENTIKAASTTIEMPGSQCNTKFKAQLGETNWLLTNTTYMGSVSNPFTKTVPFKASLEFGAAVINNASAGNVQSSETPPTFGTLKVTANVDPNLDARLVEGKYEGAVIFRLLPQ